VRNFLHFRVERTSAKLWASLTLATAVAAGSAVAAANAHRGPAHAAKGTKEKCASRKPCLTVENLDSDGIGIEGTSLATSGVYGQGDYGYGVSGSAVNGYALYGDGNVLVNGEIYTSGSCKNGCSKTRREASFVSRTSEPTIEDIGEATLHSGIARVAFAADFANAIDTRKPYVVFVTPEGDASMYVTNRTSAGFEVRQIAGGHSNNAFAYRIVAKPYADREERLPFKAVTDYSGTADRN
jgi:hypothetical protein